MEQDIGNITSTDMDSVVKETQIDSYTTEVEKAYMNPDVSMQLGFFKNTPQLNRAVKTLSTHVAGKGFTTNTATQVILDGIIGRGNESFTQIMMSMVDTMKICGDAYAEIIRNDNGTLLNFKILGTDTIRQISVNGFIVRYEQVTKTQDGKEHVRKISTEKILHLTNDRLMDENHGTSIVGPIKWIMEAKNEVMRDWRRISHRSTIRVIYVDFQDTARLKTVRQEYEQGIKSGEVLLIPAKKGEAEVVDLVLPPIDAFLRWMDYLDNFFYQVVGVPRVLVTSEGFTESGGKVGHLTFEPTYTKEQKILEDALWNQAAIRIKLKRPPSLGGNLQRDEAKDTGQLGFQPKDTEATINRE